MSGRLDADAMLRDLNSVFQKYGVERGVGFVPDVLEIRTERRGGAIKLLYRERFTYLPQEVMAAALENAISFLQRAGAPRERIRPLVDGVEVELEGPPRLIQFPMLELMIQNPRILEEADATAREMAASVRSMAGVFDFAWDFGPDAEARWRSGVARLEEIIREHPEMQAEIDEVVRRHRGQAQGF